MRSRACCIAGVWAAVFFPAFVGTARGAQTGSAVVSRPFFDSTTVVVAIYAGGHIPAGQTVTTFSWLRESFGGGVSVNKVTPLLLEETAPGKYVVRAIGTTRMISPSTAVQSAAFGAIAGSAATTNGNFTFGLLSASVSPAGVVSASTEGAVAFTFPAVLGEGLSGPLSTNRWVWSSPLFGPVTTVAVGTTSFGNVGGTTYGLNNANMGGPFVDRTYSAAVESVVPSACPGDLNGDNAVNTADLTFFLGRFGQTATPGSPAAAADFNNSGAVDTVDLVFFLGRFGSACTP
jgi:hypothetical protein